MSPAGDAIIVFLPLGRVVHVDAGTTLLAGAQREGIPLANSCGGQGVCRACRVQVIEGHMGLSPMSTKERKAASDGSIGPDERLACLAKAWGTVWISTTYW